MSFLSALLGGSTVKTMPADPRLEGMQNQMFNQTMPLGKAGKYWKNLMGRISAGDDTSSFGEFNNISQQHAANRRDIGDSYLYGGNALISSAGGESANILNRMRDTAMAKDYERQGAETGSALSQLRNDATQGFQNAFDARQNRQLQSQSAGLGSAGNYYGQRYQLGQQNGILPALMGMAGAASGMGYKPFGKPPGG
jgi:hypothetical protein